MNIELVTDLSRMYQFAEGWEALADKVEQPRAGAGIVLGWGRHMMDKGSQLRVWFAIEGGCVVGVLPFVAEPLPGGRECLLPPASTLMFGSIPIAEPDREDEIAAAIVSEFAISTSRVDLVRIDWIPVESPWLKVFNVVLSSPGWVSVNLPKYSSYYVTPEGWLDRRQSDFKRIFRRRARRQQEAGFRLLSTDEPARIIQRLPAIQTLYRQRQEARGGGGYRFDDKMAAAITEAIALSKHGRFRLDTLEGNNKVIAMQMMLLGSRRGSGWLTGFDSEWSQLAPGVAVIAGAIAISAESGSEFLEFGVGNEAYKDYLKDGEFSLESGIWCRPRMARLLQHSFTDA